MIRDFGDDDWRSDYIPWSEENEGSLRRLRVTLPPTRTAHVGTRGFSDRAMREVPAGHYPGGPGMSVEIGRLGCRHFHRIERLEAYLNGRLTGEIPVSVCPNPDCSQSWSTQEVRRYLYWRIEHTTFYRDVEYGLRGSSVIMMHRR